MSGIAGEAIETTVARKTTSRLAKQPLNAKELCTSRVAKQPLIAREWLIKGGF